MHAVYRAVPFEDVSRILEYCRTNSVQNGGLFEVYPGPEGGMEMVIVNSSAEKGPAPNFRPLGAFYCNFVAPGVISLEEEDPHFDGVPSRKRHVKAIKQVIDILLHDAFPGTRIHFQDLP
ncbi:MAG: hypothetical protein ACE5E9_09715 [Nitrospinaceae bacterium]